MNEVTLNNKVFKEILSPEDIQNVIKDLSTRINEDFKDLNPLVITVLDGAFIFAADLIRKFDFEHEFAFVKLQSYDGLESTRQVSEIWSSPKSATGRNVLIIEDIIDTGLTMNYYIQKLIKEDALSISVCSLLVKPDSIDVPNLSIKYVGKNITDNFVVGYGLDWDQKGRHFPGIYQM